MLFPEFKKSVRCPVSKVHSDNASDLSGRFVNENAFDVLDLQGKGGEINFNQMARFGFLLSYI